MNSARLHRKRIKIGSPTIGDEKHQNADKTTDHQKNQCSRFFAAKKAVRTKMAPTRPAAVPTAEATRAKRMSCERVSGVAALSSAMASNARIIPTTVPSNPQTGPVKSATPSPASHPPRLRREKSSVPISALGDMCGIASISWPHRLNLPISRSFGTGSSFQIFLCRSRRIKNPLWHRTHSPRMARFRSPGS